MGQLEQRQGQRMRAAVAAAIAGGVECVVFGDLFLADVRAYREQALAGTGLQAVFPLWGRPTAEVAAKIIDVGIEAVLTCVDPAQVPGALAGRDYDRQLLAELPAGADPCGENGEFHTFVHAMPGFAERLPVVVAAVEERDGFWYADVLPGLGLPACRTPRST